MVHGNFAHGMGLNLNKAILFKSILWLFLISLMVKKRYADLLKVKEGEIL